MISDSLYTKMNNFFSVTTQVGALENFKCVGLTNETLVQTHKNNLTFYFLSITEKFFFSLLYNIQFFVCINLYSRPGHLNVDGIILSG